MKGIKEIMVIGVGGFIGAVLRYWVSGWVQRLMASPFPYGTLAVNGFGSFCLGLLAGLAEQSIIPPEWRIFVGIGVLGAFTTFSTFSYETLMLMRTGSFTGAFLNIAISIALGLVLMYAGFWTGQMV